MIVVRLKGGLGNQMFQYALGRVLSIKNKTELGLDLGFFDLDLNRVTKRSYNLDVFNTQARIVEQKELPFLNKLYSKKNLFRFISLLMKILKIKGQEKNFAFDANIFSVSSSAYLNGHWQSFKYFKDYEGVIRKDFKLKNIPTKNILDLEKEILSLNSLCVHIRRGDYVGNKYHEVVNNEYYKKGIEYISSKTTVEKIYVFSDDIDWCRDNLKFEFPTMFVDESYAGEKGEGHMYLMSNCKNFVIPNSTFSWWGAWLSDYKDKIVVAPKQWFGDTSIDTSDLIPENWVKI